MRAIESGRQTPAYDILTITVIYVIAALFVFYVHVCVCVSESRDLLYCIHVLCMYATSYDNFQ